MEKQGYKRSTILSAVSSLRGIAKQTNLLDPEQVKRFIGSAKLTEGRKEALTARLCRFYKHKGIGWTPPHYKRINKMPFIPTEAEVNALIGGMGKKSSCFLQLLKETGCRPGEAWQLQWRDLDTERRTVNITPEKNSNGRTLRITEQCLAMLNRLPRFGPYIFHHANADPITSLVYFRRGFERRRKNLGERLQQQRLEQISFKTLRHYKATVFYHQTKDILATMQLLGHKRIENTLVYAHLVHFENENDYICKIARTVMDATALVEAGFEYVTDIDGNKLFRKRK
jgi:integrase